MMKWLFERKISIILAGLAVFSSSTSLISAALYPAPTIEIAPCTVYVNDDYTGTEPGYGFNKFNSLQPALNAVCPGGLVWVYPGNYYGGWGYTGYNPTDSSNVLIWKPLTLEGYQITASRDVGIQSMTIVPYDYSSDSGVTIIKVEADSNVAIRNLFVKGHVNPPVPPPPPDTFEIAKMGVRADSVRNFRVENVVIDSCVFGIWTYKGDTAYFFNDSLINCGIDESRGAGLYLEQTTNVLVSGCNFLEERPSLPYLKPSGIFFHEGAWGEVSYSTIVGALFPGQAPFYAGIRTDNNLKPIKILHTNILNSHNGIILGSLKDTVTIERCTVKLFTSATGNGISYFGDAQNGPLGLQIRNNLLDGNNTGLANTWGIWLTNNLGYWGLEPNPWISALIDSNEIRGFGSGIFVDAYKSMTVSPDFDISIVANEIHDNLYDGIFLQDTGHTLWGYQSTPPERVTISRNSTYGNGELGIDLEQFGEPAPGVTGNDSFPSDPDQGPNTLYNFPVIAGAASFGGQWQLTGYGHPGDLVEIFEADGDVSGYGEGRTYLTSVYVPVSGSFVALISGNPPFTATARDSFGNTSEFSLNITGPTYLSEGFREPPLRESFTVSNNPGKGSVTLEFSLRDASPLTIKIFDSSGRLLRTLLQRELRKGRHMIEWDCTGSNGERVPQGVYFVTMSSKNYFRARKVLITR